MDFRSPDEMRRVLLAHWGYPSFTPSIVGRQPSANLLLHNLLVVGLAMVGVTVVVVILQEEVLVCAIGSEGDGRDAQAGEEALETVPSAEGASIAPGLTVERVSIKRNCPHSGDKSTYWRAQGSRLA